MTGLDLAARWSSAARAVGLLVTLLLVAALVTPASAQGARPEYEVVDPSFQPLGTASVYHGTQRVQGEDAAYRIEVPADWDGTLVLYAHGYVGAGDPDLVVQTPALRDHLIGQGHAWAASSYRRNGYAVEEAVEDTHALVQDWSELTDGEQGGPDRVIVHGASMGGHVAAAAIERRPEAYDGAFPVCGVMADADLFEYFLDVNLVGGALAGVEVPVGDARSDGGGSSGRISDALALLAPGPQSRAETQYLAALEQLSGGERPLFEAAAVYWNQIAAVPVDGMRLPFLQAAYSGSLSSGIDDPPRIDEAIGNADEVYTYDLLQPPDVARLPISAAPGTADARALSAEEASLNATVRRVTPAASVRLPFPAVEGRLPVPVLTLHTLGDLFVPFRMQQVYAQRVADAGSSRRLVQRAIRAVGHCDFSAEELTEGFDDLLAWVDGGERPDGDDVADAARVRDRRFGCTFTRGERPGLAACGGTASVTRVAGEDRVATAVALSEQAWPAGSRIALVARSDVAADALAATGLAGARRAPLLLTAPGRLDPRVADELARLDPDRVLLVGDVDALARAVAQGVRRAGFDVRRIAGPGRYATAAAGAEAIAGGSGPAHAFLVRGDDPADGMAVAGLAAFLGEPILLTRPDRLPKPTADALRGLGVEAVTLVGDAGALPGGIERELAALGVSVRQRLAGEDRYATSVAVFERSLHAGLSEGAPLLANGGNFPGALTAGPAAAALGQALLLVDGSGANLQPTVERLFADSPIIARPQVVGGPSAVRQTTSEAVDAALRPPDS